MCPVKNAGLCRVSAVMLPGVRRAERASQGGWYGQRPRGGADLDVAGTPSQDDRLPVGKTTERADCSTRHAALQLLNADVGRRLHVGNRIGGVDMDRTGKVRDLEVLV